MQSLGLPPVIESLPLEIPIGNPLAGGTIKRYDIPPVSGRDYWRLRACDALWGEIGRGRLQALAQATPEQVAEAVTNDRDLRSSVIEVMESDWTAKDVIAAPLTREVHERMLADGVLDVYVKLASATAMAWHLTGDRELAAKVWRGENQGNRNARRQRTSTSTVAASRDRRASGNGTNSPRKRKKR